MTVPYWWSHIRPRAVLTDPGTRIVSELEYLGSLDRVDAKARDEAVTRAAQVVRDAVTRDGAVTEDVRARIEEDLTSFREAARSLTVHFAGHAHLDMNWMWGYDETVVIVLETMRTVLRLLDEYPEFRFSQSQGAIYRIVEMYEPELIPSIRRYVEEGRWELSATQWTENDMNLPNAESLLRHALVTIPYLQELFGVDRDALRLAFMPDTFGHSAATPEILAEAGVRWVYHCRGFTGPILTRWESPSGRSVLAYREPRWYNERVEPALFRPAAATAREAGVHHVLAVYGVGDHGGGPTRRDIDLIREMQSWPLAPTIRFSTYNDFFREIECEEPLPVVRGERNRIFTGCYSSQARIKAGNRTGQRSLFIAEVLGALTGTLRPGRLAESWRTLLFNQFHDILPGSGVPATRAWALAGYQTVSAATQVETNRALRALAERVRPAAVRVVESVRTEPQDPCGDVAEGAGVGFTVGAARASATGRWGGLVRPYLVVNPLETGRDTLVEIVVWDYPDIAVDLVDEAGVVLESEVLRAGEDSYWGHDFIVLLVRIELGPWEYRTIFLRPRTDGQLGAAHYPYGVDNWLVDRPSDLRIVNDRVELVIDPVSLAISSLVDRRTGVDLLGGDGARFVLEFEEPGNMSAWYTHRTRSATPLGPGGTVTRVMAGEQRLRSWIELELPFSAHGLAPAQGGSRLRLRAELDRGSAMVRLAARVAFRETATADLGVPRLSLRLATGFPVERARRDIPVGMLRSETDGRPHAAQSGMVVSGTGASLALVGREIQSFVATEDSLSAVLLRGSDSPDPVPEVADHSFVLYVGRYDLAADHGARRLLMEPQVVSVERPRGEGRTASGDAAGVTGGVPEASEAGLRGSLAEVTATRARIVAVKPAEREAGSVVVRLAADGDEPGSVEIGFPRAPSGARIVDAAEDPSDERERAAAVEHEGTTVRVDVPAGEILTVRVDFP